MAQAEALWANSDLPEFLTGGERVTCFGLALPGGVPCARLTRLTSRPIGAKFGVPKAAPVLITPSPQPDQARSFKYSVQDLIEMSVDAS